MNLMANKKGVLEIQFNWVLLLILGASLLILFTIIANRQKNTFDISLSISTIKSLDMIIKGIEASYDSVNLLEIPSSGISLSCNSYTIEKTTINPNSILFSPSFVGDSSIIIIKKMWEMPYKIGNFVYLVSPSIRYVFIGNSEFATEVFENIPNVIRRDGYTNVDAIQNENDKYIRLIFFDQMPKLPESLNDGKTQVTALKVTGNNEHGTVEFFNFDGPFKSNGVSHYIGIPSLLGAIFSDDIEMYKCIMDKSFKKLNLVSLIYSSKLNETLTGYSGINEACKNFYQEIIPKASSYFELLSTTKFQQNNPEDIINAANSIEKLNENASVNSCIMVY